MMATIDIARDFSITPGGRYRSEGKFSGEEFRDDVLLPAIRKVVENIGSEKLIVDLDGPIGFTTSFLEESFGNIVDRFGLEVIDSCMTLRADQKPHRINHAREFMLRAEKRRLER